MKDYLNRKKNLLDRWLKEWQLLEKLIILKYLKELNKIDISIGGDMNFLVW
jgi:hypothetical protein